MFNYQLDNYNGIVVDKQLFSNSGEQFIDQLSQLISFAKQQGKQLIWITLSIRNAKLIGVATELGFVFHNCLEDEITLILRLKKEAYAPFVPTHNIGAGALIINEKDQLLVIRERLAMHPGYKLPGGRVELGDNIQDSVVREVLEETGIDSEFLSIQGFASKHPFRFGKSDIYFICLLKATSSEINIQDTDEIAEAKWCDRQAFIDDQNNSFFVREIVKNLATAQGLQAMELAENSGPFKKQEVFFAES